MVKLNLEKDPTLVAADLALEEKAAASPYRTQTVAMSQVGDDCQRKMWYDFRWASKERMSAESLKRFEDGYHVEDLMAQRLAMVAGVEIVTRDPSTGKQFTFLDCDGHAKGKSDGRITGIIQAPKKLHVFEAKACAEKKVQEFRKIKNELGEKQTLKKWNPTYYGQAQLYMHYENTDRHYLVVGTPGLRDWDSCRTELDPAYVIQLKARMQRIVSSNDPLDKVSEKPDWWKCKCCSMAGVCHGGEMPERNCRTCTHSTPIENGNWGCERWGCLLTAKEQQEGCPAHKYLPSLVPGQVLEAGTDFIRYRMNDGSGEWIDAEGEISQ